MNLLTRLIRLVGGSALLLICVSGLINLVGHIRDAESAGALLIALLTFLIVLAFALIAVAMLAAGLSRSDGPRGKR